MPEHVHLLIGEPAVGNPSVAVMALKYCVARDLLRCGEQTEIQRKHFWQPRFYDFNVYSRHKMEEKLQYMHENPVARGLVKFPGDWAWSSFSSYVTKLPGLISVDPVN